MIGEFLPLISFVLVTTFTPGPNNISGAAMGVLYGYRATMRYLLGMLAGFFIMIQVSAWGAATLLEAFPVLQEVLRYAGAAYILYLAYATLKASYGFDERESEPLGFGNGFLLQLLNPKLIVYGLTLFSTFLAPITDQAGNIMLAATLLTGVAFLAISTWILFGSAIKRYLANARVRLAVNAALSLLLVYSALDLAGIL